MMEDILTQLNESQRKAVEYCEGPELVIAGAGSGKTRVLTYKIAYLLRQGMAPWNILALTFTNKAASEMKERIGGLVGNDRARDLWMGTFHSTFSKILRNEADLLGYTSSFTIYDEADSRSLLKAIVKEMQLDEKTYKPSAVHNRISMAKNHLCFAQQYANDGSLREHDKQIKMPELYRIYAAYESRLRQANAMDFDDLLTNTFRLLRDEPSIREKYSKRFQYVLVDEYQDTNYVQQQIVWLLTKVNQKVCVVGDDYQSIYGFRGANIDNILDFQRTYKESKLFKLEQNYRSTQRIVQAANSLMKHNQRQIDKDVYSQNEEGEKLILKPVYSDREEAAVVAKNIQRIKRQESREYSDFAILYRTNAQSRPFEEEMRRQGIPYRIYGGQSFYQRKEIKDVIAYFRLVINPDDEEAFKRIINYPTRGIGSTTVQKIIEAAQQSAVSLWQIINSPALYGLNLSKGTLSKMEGFRSMMATFVQKQRDADAYELGKEIISVSGVSVDIYSNSDPDGLSRQENLEELLNGMNDFVEGRKEEGRTREIFLADFLQEVSLLSDLDSDDGEVCKVALMTIHSAKGLEFPTVFIVGMEENIFPSPMAANSLRELEEERRLLYVAITRAERHCFLTCAKNRFRYGRMEFGTPSRFLNEIDSRFMRVEEGALSDMEFSRGKYEISRNVDAGTKAFHSRKSDYWQNSKPVAGQFMADPKPKITSRHQPEIAVDPLSDPFKQQILRSGGNLRKVSEAISNGNGGTKDISSSASMPSLAEGAMIEHQRFGLGKIIKIEGVGENTKATVEFQNVGTKQLLLKFAKFKILS